jgi:hypothetical protein
MLLAVLGLAPLFAASQPGSPVAKTGVGESNRPVEISTYENAGEAFAAISVKLPQLPADTTVHKDHVLSLVGHVAAQREHGRAERFEHGQRGPVLVLAGAPDGDARAGRGQCLGHAEPDPAVAAGDERHLPREVERLIGHVISSYDASSFQITIPVPVRHAIAGM